MGFARKEITGRPGLTLSGFVARMERPSDGVDDPLFVRAVALDSEQDAEPVLILSFDLLALGPEFTAAIHDALDLSTSVPRNRRIFCCTHTHSAPASISLRGCGRMDGRYRTRSRTIPWSAAARYGTRCDCGSSTARKVCRSADGFTGPRTLVSWPGVVRARTSPASSSPDSSQSMALFSSICKVRAGIRACASGMGRMGRCSVRWIGW